MLSWRPSEKWMSSSIGAPCEKTLNRGTRKAPDRLNQSGGREETTLELRQQDTQESRGGILLEWFFWTGQASNHIEFVQKASTRKGQTRVIGRVPGAVMAPGPKNPERIGCRLLFAEA